MSDCVFVQHEAQPELSWLALQGRCNSEHMLVWFCSYLLLLLYAYLLFLIYPFIPNGHIGCQNRPRIAAGRTRPAEKKEKFTLFSNHNGTPELKDKTSTG